MKKIITILFLTATLYSCKKENSAVNNEIMADSSATQLTGKWINEMQPADTLDVYLENRKIIMFDNSLYFRTNLAIWTSDSWFKKEMEKIEGELIYLRPYNTSGDYYENYFKWIDKPVKFEIWVQALHPELSALYKITYMKVK